jgi:hypothetical protein
MLKGDARLQVSARWFFRKLVNLWFSPRIARDQGSLCASGRYLQHADACGEECP